MYRLDYHRLLQPVLLGTIANILVNYIFDPASPDFLWDEFLAAIILVIPITEMNHFIGLRLERKFNWIDSFKKRLGLHLLFLLGASILVLNILGNIYVYFKGGDFFSLQEYIIINVVAFAVTVFLTGLSWMAFYFKRWKAAELNLQETTKSLTDMQKTLKVSEPSIQLLKGSKKIVIPANEVIAANIIHGVVRVQTQLNDSAIYSGSLAEFQKLLPDSLFFMANRSSVVRRDSILSFKSSSFGKIEVELRNVTDSTKNITVSRKKASAFRRWFNADSA